jgi:EAL domain-containing protein (putative c-di-GMP-specific phosphodiesterase class I)
MKAAGCELTQGYYLSKPLPPEALAAFVVSRT